MALNTKPTSASCNTSAETIWGECSASMVTCTSGCFCLKNRNARGSTS